MDAVEEVEGVPDGFLFGMLEERLQLHEHGAVEDLAVARLEKMFTHLCPSAGAGVYESSLFILSTCFRTIWYHGLQTRSMLQVGGSWWMTQPSHLAIAKHAFPRCIITLHCMITISYSQMRSVSG